MESLIKLQFELNNRMVKAQVNYKKCGKDKRTVNYIKGRIENLEGLWSKFESNHNELIKNCKPGELEATEYTSCDLYDLAEEFYIEFKSELKDVLDSFDVKSLNVSDSEVEFGDAKSKCCSSSQIKLPKIVIPTFSGKYLEWPTFRDLFVSLVHSNTSIDNVQKLHYLKGYLSGEAEQLVRQIPIESSNYIRCWELLEKRYNNRKYLSHCILKRMLSQKNITVESASQMKDLLDTTTDCLNGLINIGVDVSNWDILIIHLLTLKLDSETRKQWELEVTSSNTTDELPTFEQFKVFLSNRYRAFEFLDSKAVSSKPTHQTQGIKSKTFHVANDKCIMCNGDHKLSFCRDFIKESIANRRNFVEQNRVCFNCLGSNHTAKFCKVGTACRVCKSKHHSLLHPTGGQTDSGKSSMRPINYQGATDGSSTIAGGKGSTYASSGVQQSSSSQADVSSVVSCFSTIPVQSEVLLATALVLADSRCGESHVIRALLDQGSQASFVTEAMTQFLGLKKIPVKGLISGLEGNKNISCKSLVHLNIRSKLDPSVYLSVKAYVLKSITGLLPSKRVKTISWNVLKNIQLADPQYSTPGKIDVLLGAEVVSRVLRDGLRRDPSGSLIAQSTSLGWILSGEVESSCSANIMVMHTRLDTDDLLKRFWEQETDKPTTGLVKFTEAEERCEEIFAATTCRDDMGRYVVELPFKDSSPQCIHGNSKQIAIRQFLQWEKRMDKNPELKSQYKGVISEYLDMGHMQVVPVNEQDKKEVVYLPHHAVIREDKTTTKVRVVFNASCSGTNGVSLNDDLLVGPTLQPDLRHLIMRWRRYPICIVADIVKMYRQVKVAERHTDFQRLVWRNNCEDELQHLRLLRVTFGTASAPYLAVRSLQQVARDEGERYPYAAERVLKDFYMDDFLTGCETLHEGEKVYQEMKDLLGKGGFPLQKWNSNSVELLQKIKLEENKTDTRKLIVERDQKEMENVMKILGLTWDQKSDVFQYTVQLPPVKIPVTKRSVVSDVARLFDPLGWISPIVISAKILIQKLWLSGIGWDEELPEQLLQDWLKYRSELTQLVEFSLPRWIFMKSNDKMHELHGFCDASEDAFAAVVYLRVVDAEENVHVALITSKTKVAPIKQISIPRLELCGAVLVSRLLGEVADIMEIARTNIRAWTDSTVVLSWLNGQPNKWKTFVANRVSEILTTTEPHQWSHVGTKDNPADCASRGSKDLNNEALWKEGPKWLKEKIIKYNKKEITNTNLELKKKCFVNQINNNKNNQDIYNYIYKYIEKFSSLRKLLRVIAICKRFGKITRGETFESWLSQNEINESLKICTKIIQNQIFTEEINCIKHNQIINKKSALSSLNPYLDKEDVLRVGGRLQYANVSEDLKHPIILPRKSHLTSLIVADAHERTLHGGPQLMINNLRSRYWIVGIKDIVKAFVRNCVKCVRYAAKVRQQLMGQLPSARATACRPFYNSGVDYAGPINIRTSKGRGHLSYKGYICLFVCMATKAVHLEAVSDLTAQGFLSAFKRFVARRGHCAELWSDNGTNFVGAARELKVLFSQESSSVAAEIANNLANNGTNWHFIPPHSPNFGGLWEAGIKSTKHHLHRVIGNSTLTFEEMATVLTQIEACLNSRPLSRLTENAEDPAPLTPGHFLVGEPLVLAPDCNYAQASISSLSRWRLIQRMMQDFWRRWSREYLTQFHHRYKWSQSGSEPEIGDVVLVMEDGLPPAKWLYGVIIEKHTGSDGITRVVSLKCN